MILFTESEMKTIRHGIDGVRSNILITFRNRFGPTQLQKLWDAHLSELGFTVDCISWWSSQGSFGLLECQTEQGTTIFGQWAVSDVNELLGVFEISDQEVVNIRDGFDSGNVTSAAMRAFRIGETGDRD